MTSSETLKRRLQAISTRLDALRRASSDDEEERRPMLPISDEERTALIRFFRECVRGDMSEELWRAKNPKEHALLLRTCGAARSPRA